MKKSIVILLVIAVSITLLLSACGTRGKTLAEFLKDGSAGSKIQNSSAGSPIVCKDYSVYYLGGGIDDSLKATRYARGMLEVDDQFAEFDYVVKDNQTGWKYIFEVYSDLVEWAKQNSR